MKKSVPVVSVDIADKSDQELVVYDRKSRRFKTKEESPAPEPPVSGLSGESALKATGHLLYARALMDVGQSEDAKVYLDSICAWLGYPVNPDPKVEYDDIVKEISNDERFSLDPINED